MPHIPGADRLDQASRKWRDLAEKRLAYFVELYQSGRWQHYYTQERFAMRMLDVIKAAKTWAELAEQAPATKTADRDRMRSAA